MIIAAAFDEVRSYCWNRASALRWLCLTAFCAGHMQLTKQDDPFPCAIALQAVHASTDCTCQNLPPAKGASTHALSIL